MERRRGIDKKAGVREKNTGNRNKKLCENVRMTTERGNTTHKK